jgi:hypothetical protein
MLCLSPHGTSCAPTWYHHYTMLCDFFAAARSDAPFTIVLRSPTGSWMGKSMIPNISAKNKYQPNIHAPNANPPPT